MIKISFDKELLLERCRADVANKTSMSETPLDMCEHDREWGKVALMNAARTVECELMRIARTTENPLTDDPTTICFEIDPTTHRHAKRLAEAAENYLVTKVCEDWARTRSLPLDFGSKELLGNLKHLTLKKEPTNV